MSRSRTGRVPQHAAIDRVIAVHAHADDIRAELLAGAPERRQLRPLAAARDDRYLGTSNVTEGYNQHVWAAVHAQKSAPCP
jgi:hypothetical protein